MSADDGSPRLGGGRGGYCEITGVEHCTLQVVGLFLWRSLNSLRGYNIFIYYRDIIYNLYHDMIPI